MRPGFDGGNALPVNVRYHGSFGFGDAAVRLVGEISGHGLVCYQSRTLAYQQAHQLAAGQIADVIGGADPAELDKERRARFNAIGFQTLPDRCGAVQGIGFDCRGGKPVADQNQNALSLTVLTDNRLIFRVEAPAQIGPRQVFVLVTWFSL